MYQLSRIKKCNWCNESKDNSEFYKHATNADGLSGHCKLCHNKWRKGEYAKTKDRSLFLAREWQKAHPDKVKKYEKKHREKFKVERSNHFKKWQKNNRARLAFYSFKRRSKFFSQSEHFTEQQWIDLCERCGGVCVCCGEKKRIYPDHIIPIVHGGMNDIGNIQPLCQKCNIRKSIRKTNYLLKRIDPV